MKFTTTILSFLVALRSAYALPTNQTSIDDGTQGLWKIFFYEDGCPADGPGEDDGNEMDAFGTEYCQMTTYTNTPVHNIYLEGVAGVYTVTLFANEVCSGDVIATFSGDGCYVLPANTGVETFDVVAIN